MMKLSCLLVELMLLSGLALAESNPAPLASDTSVLIRTCYNQLSVSQNSSVGNRQPGGEFHWWVDTSEYLYDGSLIIGTGRENMNLSIFHAEEDEPLPENPWRHLLPLGTVTYDSTGYCCYRFAEGLGCTEDSTIAFTSKYYASKHPDTADFYIAHFDIYAGPNWSEAISGVRIAYAIDWNVPSDTGFDNSAGLLPEDQALYQKGEYDGSPNLNASRYGCIAYRSDIGTSVTADGGFVWDNDRYVTPFGGYQVDSLIKYIDQTEVTPYFALSPDADSITDYSSVLVIDRDAVIGEGDTISFSVVIACNNPYESSSLGTVEQLLAGADCFIKAYVATESDYCYTDPCGCGDADGNGIVGIADAQRLLTYFLGVSDPPDPLCMGEADHCDGLDFNDMIYILCYVFSGCTHPCDASVDCSYPADNTRITLGCSVEVDDPRGGSIALPVYLDNDHDLASVSVGFHYNSDGIDIESVSFVGTIEPVGYHGFALLFPEEHLVWLGGFDGVVAQEGGLLATIYVNVPPLTPNQVIDFDTAYAPRVGSPAFMLENGDKLIPQYVDCGQEDLIINMPPPLCGDADFNQLVNIADAVHLINYIFASGPAPFPMGMGDTDCDSIVNIADAVYLIAYIFGGGPEPCADCP